MDLVLFFVVLLAWLLLNAFLFISGLFNHNLSGKFRIMFCVAFVVSSVAMAFVMSNFFSII